MESVPLPAPWHLVLGCDQAVWRLRSHWFEFCALWETSWNYISLGLPFKMGFVWKNLWGFLCSVCCSTATQRCLHCLEFHVGSLNRKDCLKYHVYVDSDCIWPGHLVSSCGFSLYQAGIRTSHSSVCSSVSFLRLFSTFCCDWG